MSGAAGSRDRLHVSQCPPIVFSTTAECNDTDQELLEDLRQKFPVVGDQPSWMDDADPFCCDRCWSNSPRPETPGHETPTTAPPPTDNPEHGPMGAAAGHDTCIGGNSRHPVSSGCARKEETPVSQVADGSNPESDGGNRDDGSYGASSFEQSDGQANGPPVLFPTEFRPGPFNEFPGTNERLRGVGTMLSAGEGGVTQSASRGSGLGRQGRRTGVRPPTTKPDAVAAAFSAHLHGVDKYPLELARLCRFAQFLTENELLREAYEVGFAGALNDLTVFYLASSMRAAPSGGVM